MEPNRYKNNRRETAQRAPQLLDRQKVRREKRRARQIRNLKIVAAILFPVILIFFSPLFRVSQLELTGFVHADTAALGQAAAAQMGRHFLFLDEAALQDAIMADPWIQELTIKTSAGGQLTLQGLEYTRDYALVHDGEVYLLDRQGRILDRGIVLPEDVTQLVDDTVPLTPGATMYGEGAKRRILTEFGDLMDQNVSAIHFDRLDITDPANILMDHGAWTVQIGDGAGLKTKLNQAINILKTVTAQQAPGIIDLKFDAPPVIRPKGGS